MREDIRRWLIEYFGETDWAVEWLTSPCKQLRHRTPLIAMREGDVIQVYKLLKTALHR